MDGRVYGGAGKESRDKENVGSRSGVVVTGAVGDSSLGAAKLNVGNGKSIVIRIESASP